MPERGWRQLLAGYPWFRHPGGYPLPAYSEFMPPPRLGRKPCGEIDQHLFAPDDELGWRISEREELLEIRPGLEHIASELLHRIAHLGRGNPAHGISHSDLRNNPFWPSELQESGAPAHERTVLITTLALARTQDDKGRVRWTLFGGSEQGTARPFWKSSNSEQFIARLLHSVYGEAGGLSSAGFRIFEDRDLCPAWAHAFRWEPHESVRGVRYVLTFKAYATLPAALKDAYRSGDIHLIPFPGSLVFWGSEAYVALQRELPLAMQIPLLHSLPRHESLASIRVPQSGWLHEPSTAALSPHPGRGPYRQHFQRTHRWAKVRRDENELDVAAPAEDKVAPVLFSTEENDVDLYGKPMARNAQIWTADHRLVLDGPQASPNELRAAHDRVRAGGTFGYRFIYPPMQVGLHQMFWHRPLVAYIGSDDARTPHVMHDAPAGILMAYDASRPALDTPVELWPRILDRPAHRIAVVASRSLSEAPRSALRLLEVFETTGEPIDREFAAHLTRHGEPSGEPPAEALCQAIGNRVEAALLSTTVGSLLRAGRPIGDPLTYHLTARRSFEKAYWNSIKRLAMGRFLNKDNADCVLDRVTQRRLRHHQRDLEPLAGFLVERYGQLIRQKPTRGAAAGVIPFHWRTDFPFEWSEGWLRNQGHTPIECDVIFRIPGRNRRRAVIMADHYDTAYMEDVYGYGRGGGGPRLAARGADDNHSATATLLLAAPIFLDLSREGRLACDVWLVHLTGEEFPADCLGARHLTERIVEGNLALERQGRRISLSETEIAGVFVLDMIAHNNDKHRDVFQISPGEGRGAIRLAEHAAAANRSWNALVPGWNARGRRHGRGKRSQDGSLPALAEHRLLRGEVRLHTDPHSTLYNTDAQIFSDAGLPVVLFMENYDIDRHGYHDSHDTMENIDLDYGSALAAIAIETVARTAAEKMNAR